MFKNILPKIFRLSAITILVIVIMTDSNSALAQHPLLVQTGSAGDVSLSTRGNSPNLPTPLDPSRISFQEAATGLTSPVLITNAGDGSGRIFVVEQTGNIRILKNGSLLGTPFLNVSSLIKSGAEQGLLALAFHPSYKTNGIFFVVYTAPVATDAIGANLVLEKFSVSANPDLANPGSGVVLLSISHPSQSNHNGGTLAFGGDGYLYWSTGDGGSGGDPPNNSQQLNNLLGKILRLDVNSGSPYGIPTSNPFYSNPNPTIKKEIWAYGLRNPWRLSFDRLTHDLYIGDVGQSAREEVDFQLASSAGGQNYGWRVMEGSSCYNSPGGCDQSGKILPVTEYDHSVGCSITGGYVYRGSNFPSLGGHYFYGDYCSGRLFSLFNDPILGWQSIQLADTPYNISTFGEDEQGELYLSDLGTGKLYNIRYLEIPTVLSSARAGANPTDQTNVNFTVTFSHTVTGVDMSDFTLTTTGVSGAAVSGVSGSGSVYTVSVNTGTDNGTARLNVIDDDSIKTAGSYPLGGAGAANGNFTTGEVYTVLKTTFFDVPTSNPYWDDVETLYANGLTAGCSLTPLNFCPDQIMDRAQSAVFTLRGNYGTGYTPPPAPWDSFADDWSPGTWAEKWAEGMYNAGLTAGCSTNPLLYCPWDQTPRVQAAIFGLRLKYGNSYVPPEATGTVFFDMTDTAYFGTKWAEQAYADGLLPNCGIDIGSGKPLFCPNDLVSRGLAAYMIVRAKNLTTP
jgi:glucose/arabinose dehydrogenase